MLPTKNLSSMDIITGVLFLSGADQAKGDGRMRMKDSQMFSGSWLLGAQEQRLLLDAGDANAEVLG